ncbi:PREDICTED: protein RRP6-like 2 isoform X2 [Tarenaya hassleriana]|uniref:protein RRP6-like 2 isoform X2 n=1 Tax=Tarenaya hassleriana TaxID=28532 RepID=UPI00053CA9D5|nr:PREDICTED: protein RRP6-like 2 isoform X2 [Tarenaya hassleriana]
MVDDQIELEQSPVSRKAKSLETLIGGSFPASLSKLSSSSCAIPANKDFHFFYNFDEFKRPTDGIAGNSQSVLETIGDSPQVWGKPMLLSGDIDGDDAYDWLVNVTDAIYERFDDSMDEFDRIRKKEEEIGRALGPVTDENGFQMVYGRKQKAVGSDGAVSARGGGGGRGGVIDVKVAERDKKVSVSGKAKVPFHMPTIKKPQEEYNICVNNANHPFEHVWLEKHEDGQRFIHPLENHSVMDFVDTNIGETEPVKSLPMKETPFKFVQEVKDLKDLADKLCGVEEFAVDLEHNQYRSFQGLTCLMQISTRTEDYIVDTFKLRVHIGSYLREIFKDPKKKKVMHGADRDVIWLQRDFGIYICNLFDTGQASRVLKLERNSLQFLLQHFCGVTANKEYQNADWRIRPLPDEMIRYAREDTHYLLYIYDLMRLQLQTVPKKDEQSDSPLIEVYKRSYDVCMQLYEKELLTENSYLHIYGLQGAGFNAVQLAIVSSFSLVFVIIAKEMPVTTSKLRRLLKSRHLYIERNIDSVISVIRQSMQNASAFEATVQSLKEGRLETVSYKNSKPTPKGIDESSRAGDAVSPKSKERSLQGVSNNNSFSTVSVNTDEGRGLAAGLFSSEKVSAAVQISKTPSSGFGALLGNAASKRKFGTDNKPKEKIKLEQIRSSVSLPFHSFMDKSLDQTSQMVSRKPEGGPTKPVFVYKPDNVIVLVDDSDEEPLGPPVAPSSASVTLKSEISGSKSEDVILLDDNSDEEPETDGESRTCDAAKEKESAQKVDGEDGPMSLSEVSSKFPKCFKQKEKPSAFMSLKPGFLNLKPYDYEAAARKEIRFREPEKGEGEGKGKAKRKRVGDSEGKKKGLETVKVDEATEFGQGKRRQAFPASGNRSKTFLS